MKNLVCNLLISTGLSVCPVPAQANQPNIIVIMTDDQDDMGSIDSIPNVQALAHQGTRFINSFVTTPLCSPSRTSFLTGQYAHNHGIWDNDNAHIQFRPLEPNTLNVWLQNAGYSTGLIGKYMNGFTSKTYVPPGWNSFKALLTLAPSQGGGYYDFEMNENGVGVKYSGIDNYSTDIFTNQAVNFIDAQTGPFFLLITARAPHSPATPATIYEHTFDAVPLPSRPNFNEYDVSDKSHWVHDLPWMTPSQVNNATRIFRQRRETLLSVDDMVGVIRNELLTVNKLNNTIIVYTSDNGYSEGQHRWIEKQLPYEEDVRVPLIISGPGIPQNETRDKLAINLDLTATIAEWSGAVSSNPLDGRSLIPIINDGATRWRRAFMVESKSQSNNVEPTFVRAVRALRYIYARFESEAFGIEEEIYDLNRDEFQMQSGLTPSKISVMVPLWDQLVDCAGFNCWIKEPLE